MASNTKTAEVTLPYPSADTTPSTVKPNVLWSLRFNHLDTSEVTVRSESAPSNFLVTPGPGAVLDYDAAVAKARELFQLIAPDRSAEEFLPPAPNPEDIYVEEVDPTPAAAPAQDAVIAAAAMAADDAADDAAEVARPPSPPEDSAEQRDDVNHDDVRMEIDEDNAALEQADS